ncbi:ATP phosphoribosyltransferase (EC [uncultured Gammaproteobacteria bacterium]|nr:ATP phosphoribosyltransferase (EC [uncultured Gammaproteobacteria bacterium]
MTKKIKTNTLKIATKYVNSAKRYFDAKNQQTEIIKLYGAMELAPVVGFGTLYC